eukprot:756211-Hanusia_phi.AAC.9
MPRGDPGDLAPDTLSGLGSFSIGEFDALEPRELDETWTFMWGTTTKESRFKPGGLVMYLKGRES